MITSPITASRIISLASLALSASPRAVIQRFTSTVATGTIMAMLSTVVASATASAERVNEVLEEHRLELGVLYDEGLEPHVMRRQKAAILQGLCTSLGRKSSDDCDINNATLALHRSYEGGHCAFARLYDETGRDIRRFHDASRAVSRWPAECRSAWLERPCNPVAPGHEL